MTLEITLSFLAPKFKFDRFFPKSISLRTFVEMEKTETETRFKVFVHSKIFKKVPYPDWNYEILFNFDWNTIANLYELQDEKKQISCFNPDKDRFLLIQNKRRP